MGLFIIGTECRRELMGRCLDAVGVRCRETESVPCDRCGEGVGEWMDEQQRAGLEWKVVEEMLDKVRQGCAICCMLGEAGSEGWRTQQVDPFRTTMRDRGDSHSCRRCWVSQKYCATGDDVNKACQWPNVVVPLVRALAESDAVKEMI